MLSRFKVLVIGAGGIGARHIATLLKTGRVEVGIVEPDENRRHRIAAEFGNLDSYAQLDQIPDAEFKAAVVATPAHLHIPIAADCIARGMAVLIEKPLSASLDGVDELETLAAARQALVRVAYPRRFDPGIRQLREQLRSGFAGNPMMALVNCGQDFRKYRPDYQSTYYARRASGGGVILDGASHYIDLILWLLGPAVEVVALSGRLEFEGVECEDTAVISLRLASGGLVQLALNQFQKPLTSSFEVIGTAGNLCWDEVRGELKGSQSDSEPWSSADLYQQRARAEMVDIWFEGQAHQFLDAIEGKADELATLAEAKHNLEICLAALQGGGMLEKTTSIIPSANRRPTMDLDRLTQDYERDGYICVHNFFSPQEVADLRHSIERYTEQNIQSLPAGDYVLEADGKSVRNLWRMEVHDPSFINFALQPRITELVARLVHGEPVLLGVETFNKPAKIGSGVPAHQDNAYFCQSPPDVLTVWISIDASTTENGAIYYRTGSHLEGVFPHKKSGVQGNSMGLIETPETQAYPEFCGTIGSGDVLIHHSQTIHRSEPNKSDKSRLACLLVFGGSHTQKDPTLSSMYQTAK